ncbi:tRNA guanosine(34) transglycosylase Tgt, partial [bacterium]|nr:tRNA guanosine(34) transglycosylase Tgt [bacterium]
MFDFTVDTKLGAARLTTLTTPHGAIRGPFFQFVATQAAIRGQVYSEDLEKLGVQIILANTYHLHLRPGEQLIAEAGGLHEFMQWEKPITTDSGGYQVFSLGQNVKIDPDGVTFRSPINGDEHRFTPESTIDVERQLGADIIMPLDIATPFDASESDIEQAVAQTIAWAKRCQTHHQKLESKEAKQALYGIVQGGLVPSLRAECAAALIEL